MGEVIDRWKLNGFIFLLFIAIILSIITYLYRQTITNPSFYWYSIGIFGIALFLLILTIIFMLLLIVKKQDSKFIFGLWALSFGIFGAPLSLWLIIIIPLFPLPFLILTIIGFIIVDNYRKITPITNTNVFIPPTIGGWSIVSILIGFGLITISLARAIFVTSLGLISISLGIILILCGLYQYKRKYKL